jgi:hypothetical protein
MNGNVGPFHNDQLGIASKVLPPIKILILITLVVSGIARAQDDGASTAPPINTGFTYQGRIEQNGSPVNATCDMRFKLYDSASMGSQIGNAINVSVPIDDGYFAVNLDFGVRAFTGERRWLGIEVSFRGGGIYTDLGRQELMATPYALYATSAPWNGLTNIPSGFADGNDGVEYANVIVVAKSGGDYASIQAAIDSITDANSENPYLVWVAPGVYSETVTMKSHVHLQGAGQEATIITSAVTNDSLPPDQATLVLTWITSLRDVTISNHGDGIFNVALLAPNVTRASITDVTAETQGKGMNNHAIFLDGRNTLRHVTALAKNGSIQNYGLLNYWGANTMLYSSSFTARGGTYAQGIHSVGSDTILEATDITSLAQNGSNSNYGLYNLGSAKAILHDGSFTGRGGANTGSIYNTELATLEAIAITGLAENGSGTNCGLYNKDSAKAVLRDSSFTVREGLYAQAIYNTSDGTTLEAIDVTALIENATIKNYGLINTDGAEAVLRDGSFSTYGGRETRGIYNHNAATLEANNVTAQGRNGSLENYGLVNKDGAAAILRGGSFSAYWGNNVHGILNTGDGTALEANDVTARGESGPVISGLYNRDGAYALLYGGLFVARVGDNAYGIRNTGSDTTLLAMNAIVLSVNDFGNTYSLYNDGGAHVTLSGDTFIALGGDNTYGIYNADSGTTLKGTNITAQAKSGDDFNAALVNTYSATAEVDSSQLTGSTWGLYLLSGDVHLGVTQLVGGVGKSVSSTLTCFQVYDENYASFTCP